MEIRNYLVDSPPVIKLSPQQGGERVRVIF